MTSLVEDVTMAEVTMVESLTMVDSVTIVEVTLTQNLTFRRKKAHLPRSDDTSHGLYRSATKTMQW